VKTEGIGENDTKREDNESNTDWSANKKRGQKKKKKKKKRGVEGVAAKRDSQRRGNQHHVGEGGAKGSGGALHIQ